MTGFLPCGHCKTCLKRISENTEMPLVEDMIEKYNNKNLFKYKRFSIIIVQTIECFILLRKGYSSV